MQIKGSKIDLGSYLHLSCIAIHAMIAIGTFAKTSFMIFFLIAQMMSVYQWVSPCEIRNPSPV